MRVGELHRDAFGVFNLGDHTRGGQRSLAQRRMRRTARPRPDAPTDEEISAVATPLRRSHPYDRSSYSQQWLANETAKKLKADAGVVYLRLRALPLG